MKCRVAFAPMLVVAWIFACSSNSMNQGDTGDGNASMAFTLSGGDFTGNSVRICGSRPAPDPKYRCNFSLTPDTPVGIDAGDACPCFNFHADGSLVDGNNAPAVIHGLCPSADFPTANWAFSYALFSAPDCGGAQLNNGIHNFTCYDSTDIATQAFPNQSVDDVLTPGLNTNHILCNTVNASKSWNFGSCATATTAEDTAVGHVRFDCGCTPVDGGACDCGDGGVIEADLEIGCSFDSVTCNVLCGPPVVAPQGSCLAASAPSVLISGTEVFTYIPHGIATPGQNSRVGISIIPIEGPSTTTYIWSTPVPLLSCASNSVTGQTVCTGNDASVYIYENKALTTTLTSAATGKIQSDVWAACTNCGVVMDPIHNRALLSMSLGGVPGFQFLDLSDNTFLPPFASQAAGQGMTMGFLLDPIRNLVLAPTMAGTYEIIDVADPSAPQFFERATSIEAFTAAGEDCTTGIVASTAAPFPSYAPYDISLGVYLGDLRQSTFTPGAPAGTWSGPVQVQTLSVEDINFFYGLTSIAIAQGTHQGVMSDIAGHSLTAIQLPPNPGRNIPAIADWVSCDITPGVSGYFLQTLTAYTSPNTGHAMAVVSPYPYGGQAETVVDLTMMLDPTIVPRTANGHACADGTLPSSVKHSFVLDDD